MEVVNAHTGGDPMGYTGIWTYLSKKEIKEKLLAKSIVISEFVISNLMKIHKLGKRKVSKSQTIKEVKFRDDQFKNIEKLVKEARKLGMAVLSIDTKKKESLGNLYREGKVYCSSLIKCYDHDYASLREGVVYPHGIYDLFRNEGYINLTSSKDTAEFCCDNLEWWWNNYGKKNYEGINTLLILCDGGGSNSSSHYIFKEELQKLANRIGLNIRIAHYPPYCSKYNPIEHKMFPHITRALGGIILDNMETMKKLIEERAKTSQGLNVFVNIVDKIYQTGRKAPKEFIENIQSIIKFDKTLKKWNYLVAPS